MKKLKFSYIFILQILFFSIIFTNIQAKNLKLFYKGPNVSNYFSGIISLNENNYANSYKYFKKLDGLEEKHYRYSQVYLYSLINADKFSEAFRYSKKLEQKKINSFESDLIIGSYYLKKNNFDQAKRYFEKLKKRKNQSPLQKLLSDSLSTWINLDKLKYSEARELLNNIDPRFQNLKKIQTAFLDCYFNEPETTTSFNNLFKDKSYNFSRYHFFHSNYLISQNKIKKAEETIDLSLKEYPKNLMLNQLKIDLKIENKDDFKNYFNCNNRAHVSGELFYITANALSSRFIYSISNFYLNLAKFLNPKFISYNTLYADNLYMIDNLKKSQEVHEQLKSTGRIYDRYTSKQISAILIDQKKNKEALILITSQFDKIKNPNVYEIFDYAEFLKNNNKFQESTKYYTQALQKIDRNHKLYPEIKDGRGISYERTGNWEKAEQDLLSSLEASPNQAYVINYLAYSWIEKGVKIDKALKMLRKANDLKKNDGYITDSLGWALFKLEKYKDSKKYLELAVSLMPSDPIINDHYGDSLWMNGKKIQARYYWNYVLNLKKAEDELKEKISEKLIHGLKVKL